MRKILKCPHCNWKENADVMKNSFWLTEDVCDHFVGLGKVGRKWHAVWRKPDKRILKIKELK